MFKTTDLTNFDFLSNKCCRNISKKIFAYFRKIEFGDNEHKSVHSIYQFKCKEF